MGGMFDVFQTDEHLEATGVWIDYGDFRVLIASAGQGNKKYVSYAEKKLKPLNRAIEAGALDRKRQTAIMAEIYSKTVVLNWQMSNGEGGWADACMESKDGDRIDFNEENVILTFKLLPRLFQDIQEQAQSIAIFRQEQDEEDSGNS